MKKAEAQKFGVCNTAIRQYPLTLCKGTGGKRRRDWRDDPAAKDDTAGKSRVILTYFKNY
jgi:hypothetical protein